MIVKKGEVFTIASGCYEGYDRAGPFVAIQDINVDAFVAEATVFIGEVGGERPVVGDCQDDV